jgi:hypothetical protein
MSTRFLTNATVALLAGFVVVASQTFATSTTAWVAFAIAIGVGVIALAAQLDRSRGAVQRGLDGATVILAGWTVIASLIFTGSTVMWLSLAEALGLVGLAFAGLTLHEIATWRAQRGLTPLRLVQRESTGRVTDRAAA